MPALVTQQSLTALLNNPATREKTIGRALVHLFNNQTDSEQSSNATLVHNMQGFTGADANSGSLTAKYYLKHKRLEQWQMDRWTKPNRNGVPRLAKYHKQLNQIAIAQAKAKEGTM